MKKHVLMMAAVCLLMFSAKANDVVEQLCADEVFVAMVKQSEQVTKHMLSLNDSQREHYLRSEEFGCFRENFLRGTEHLSVTYNLSARADRQVVLLQAIKKVTMQQDPRFCENYYNLWLSSCFSMTNPFAQAECFANAYAWYTQCMGGGVS
jgi:hypothetical protein